MQRRMQEAANARKALHACADKWKVFEEVNVAEKRIGEPFRGCRMLLP